VVVVEVVVLQSIGSISYCNFICGGSSSINSNISIAVVVVALVIVILFVVVMMVVVVLVVVFQW
jgi:hypothetical protein